MPKQIFKRETSSHPNSRGADLIFFQWYHPRQSTSYVLAGTSRGAGPEGNKPLQWMEQLSWLRAIALGCLQAQADITTFSRYSSQFLGLGTNVSFFNGSWNWVVTSQNQGMESNICSCLTLVWRSCKLRGQFTSPLVQLPLLTQQNSTTPSNGPFVL